MFYFTSKMTFVHDCAVDVTATLCDVMAADEHYLHTSSQVGPLTPALYALFLLTTRTHRPAMPAAEADFLRFALRLKKLKESSKTNLIGCYC